MKLEALRREDMSKLLEWRNAFPEAWRDPRPTTITQQYEWFDSSVSHSNNGRYWGFYEVGHFRAQSEITSIIWESRIGEIGLIVDPKLRKLGMGKDLLLATLTQAWNTLNLKTVWGECYECNDACNFWMKCVKEWNGYLTILKNRKYWNGKFYDSIYFSWDRETTQDKVEAAGQSHQLPAVVQIHLLLNGY